LGFHRPLAAIEGLEQLEEASVILPLGHCDHPLEEPAAVDGAEVLVIVLYSVGNIKPAK